MYERLPRTFEDTLSIEVHDCDLDDAMTAFGPEACRRDIDDGVSRTGHGSANRVGHIEVGEITVW